MSAPSFYQPERKWLRIHIDTPAILVEPVAGILTRLTGSGVEINDILGVGQKATVIGYLGLSFLEEIPRDTESLAGNEHVEKYLEELRRDLDELRLFTEEELPEVTAEVIDEEDWSSTWKVFFKSFEIIPGLIIKPSWEECSPKKDRRVLELDPGMAFGTGQHATTAMALSLLHSLFPAGAPKMVLDVGTGTGILGMAAALFGADRVICIDNDPEAIGAAIENVRRNHLDHAVQVGNTPLAEVKGHFDVVCSNIVHDVLVDMAPEFARLLTGKGHLVLSGILKGEQEKNILEVYAPLGFKAQTTKYDKEWAAIVFGQIGVATSLFVE